MAEPEVILFGASGHAKVVISALWASGRVVKALFDDNPQLVSLYNYPVIGTYTPSALPRCELIISIGNNYIRQRVALGIQHKIATAQHPSAITDSSVCIGEGTVVLHGAILQASASIGRHVIINTAASVDHDCHIADFVHVAPNATLCGGVQVGEGTHIGAGAVVIQGIRIGKWATVGAGAVVIRDVPDYAVVVGNPAKIIRYQTHE